MRRLPKGTGFPLLLVLGLGLTVLVLDRDPVGALALMTTVAAAVLVVALLMLAARQRVRRRRRQMPPGHGLWRATPDGAVPDELMTRGPLGWLVDRETVDVLVSPSALRLVPVGATRVLGRCTPVDLRWDEVATVEVEPRVWEVGGKPTPVPRTPVVLVLVGDRVDELFRPMTDAEAAEEGLTPQERAEEDDASRELGREVFGPGHRFGTEPLRLLVDDAADLVPLLQRYRRGHLPDLSRGRA